MKCPRCGMLMSRDKIHNFCTHCGYLDDGKQIHGYTEEQASDLEIYLGKDFDKIFRNTNWLSNLILGPFYLCFRGFILPTLFFIPIELFIWDFIGNSFSTFSIILKPLAFLITRSFFMATNNMMCIYFYQRRIDRLKKKYPATYLDILRNSRKQIHPLLSIGVIILAIIICVFLLLYFFHKAMH